MPDDLDAAQRALTGRLVLITGASSGIGAAAAVALAPARATFVLVARREDRLEEVATRVRALGSAAIVLAADLSDAQQATRTAHEIRAQHGTPDVIVLAAGHSIARPILDSAERFDTFERTMGVNYLGVVALLLPFLPEMAQRRSGHLIAITSFVARMPMPGWSAYSASKSAMDSWLRSVEPELRRNGIAVTTLPMPLIDTDMVRPVLPSGHRSLRPVSHAVDWIATAIVTRRSSLAPWWQRPGEILGAIIPVYGARMAGHWSLPLASRTRSRAERARRRLP